MRAMVFACPSQREWTLHDDDQIPDRVHRELTRLQQEKRELQSALHTAERERDDALHSLDTPAIAISYMGRDGTILMVNQAGARNMGGKPSEFLGKTMFEVFPQLAAQTRERIDQVLDGGQPLVFETALDGPGGRRWFRTTYHPVPANAGRPEMVQLISQDITEHVRLQHLLDSTEGRLANVLEHAPFLIALVDPEGIIRYVNRVHPGKPRDQLIGTSVTERVPSEEVPRVLDALAAVRKTHAPRMLAITDLTGLHYEIHLAPIVRDGEVAQIVAFLADVSERVAAAERERQLELQVQRAQKLESLGVLAGGIAHDFNNLLVGVLGNAQLALGDREPEHIDQYMHGIMQAAQRAAELCRQMLAYAGRGELRVEPIDLSALSLDILGLLRASVSKRAQVLSECPPGLPPIRGDGTQLRQVVMNLLTNASDALEGRDGTITLRCGVSAHGADPAFSPLQAPMAPGPHVYIEVVDTGCGMDEQTRARMFDPFFTSKQLGSGLGLASTLGIIRSHHGGIEVESTHGQGTRVCVLLPAAEAIATKPPGPSAASKVACGTILLVEDEEAVRSVAQRALELSGHRVLIACDGLEALACYDGDPKAVDAVLMDLSMPRMDGHQASRALRERDPRLPIVLASGFAVEGTDPDIAPPAYAISKPYDLDELIALLNHALCERRR